MGTSVPILPLVPWQELSVSKDRVRLNLSSKRKLIIIGAAVDEKRSIGSRGVFLEIEKFTERIMDNSIYSPLSRPDFVGKTGVQRLRL